MHVTIRESIREHMDVVGSDGQHIGTVDHLEGADDIKLTKGDAAAGGKHHMIPVGWVVKVDQQVHISKSGAEAKAQWKTAA